MSFQGPVQTLYPIEGPAPSPAKAPIEADDDGSVFANAWESSTDWVASLNTAQMASHTLCKIIHYTSSAHWSCFEA